MSAQAFTVEINPAVLRWARETAGHRVEDVAPRVNTTPRTVKQWESGEKHPPWRSLRKLAEYYKRPVAALLLPEPPKEPALPTDFRVHPGRKKELSAKTLLAIRTARWLQRHALELRQQLKPETEFTGPHAHLRQSTARISQRVRAFIGIDVSEQRTWPNEYQAFKRWRQALEEQNLLVFQFPMPGEDRLSGFSLFDACLPVIVVNQSDAVLRRIFTLFHEYGHLLLRNPGICLPEETAIAGGQNIEPFCNRLAAEILVPRAEFERWNTSELPSPDDPDDKRFRQLAHRYWVSRYVILGRLRAAGAFSDSAYNRISQHWRSKTKSSPPSKQGRRGGGQRAHQICINQRGKAFVSLVIQGKQQGLITTQDALTYLGVKRLRDLRKLESLR